MEIGQVYLLEIEIFEKPGRFLDSGVWFIDLGLYPRKTQEGQKMPGPELWIQKNLGLGPARSLILVKKIKKTNLIQDGPEGSN